MIAIRRWKGTPAETVAGHRTISTKQILRTLPTLLNIIPHDRRVSGSGVVLLTWRFYIRDGGIPPRLGAPPLAVLSPGPGWPAALEWLVTLS